MNNISNEAAPVINKLDDIARCPNCNLICSLKLNYKEGNPINLVFQMKNVKIVKKIKKK